MFVAAAAFLLLALVAYLIVRPVVLPEGIEEEPEASGLLAEKERLLDAIRDLALDLATGKLDEADHRALRGRYVADAARIVQSIEESVERAPREAAPWAADEPSTGDDLELEIARRKQLLERRACPSCGGVRGDLDRFCRLCGAELEEVG